jgi:hypothetical protein
VASQEDTSQEAFHRISPHWQVRKTAHSTNGTQNLLKMRASVGQTKERLYRIYPGEPVWEILYKANCMKNLPRETYLGDFIHRMLLRAYPTWHTREMCCKTDERKNLLSIGAWEDSMKSMMPHTSP